MVELDLELEDVPDFSTGQIETRRTDSGERVGGREMTATERRMELADVGLRNS
jgi:hypothetical protein